MLGRPVPCLDNRDDIQQLLTDLTRAIAAETIDHNLARHLMSVLRLASRQFPRRAISTLPAAAVTRKKARPEPKPIEEVFSGPNGEDLAPEAHYGAQARPERKWSFAEYLYHKAFPGNEDKPLSEEGYEVYNPPTKEQPAPAARGTK